MPLVAWGCVSVSAGCVNDEYGGENPKWNDQPYDPAQPNGRARKMGHRAVDETGEMRSLAESSQQNEPWPRARLEDQERREQRGSEP